MSIRRSVVSLVLVALCAPGAAAQEAPGGIAALTCESCLVVDDSGRTLWRRRAHDVRPPASTTKMLTALVVRREIDDLSREVVVPSSILAVTGGRLGLEPGERLSVQELLYVLLMSSSNHAAITLAEAVAGSEARFTPLMNSLARELGARATRMTTSHGLDAPGHGSSAHDLVLIAETLLADPSLAEIVSTPAAAVSSDRRRIELENTNELLEGYRGLTGVKTGFTARAGNVLVGSAERQGRRVIAVAMGSDDAFADVRALLDHGFGRLRRGVILRAGESVGSIVFDPGGSVVIAAGATVRGLARPEDVVIDFIADDTVGPPVRAGEVVGRVELERGGRVVDTVPAVASAGVGSPGPPGWPLQALTTCLRWAAGLPGLT